MPDLHEYLEIASESEKGQEKGLVEVGKREVPGALRVGGIPSVNNPGGFKQEQLRRCDQSRNVKRDNQL